MPHIQFRAPYKAATEVFYIQGGTSLWQVWHFYGSINLLHMWHIAIYGRILCMSCTINVISARGIRYIL